MTLEAAVILNDKEVVEWLHQLFDTKKKGGEGAKDFPQHRNDNRSGNNVEKNRQSFRCFVLR